MKKRILLGAAAAVALAAAAHAQDASFWYRHPVAGIDASGSTTAPSNSRPEILGLIGSLAAAPGEAVSPFSGVSIVDPDETDILTATLSIDLPAAGSVTDTGGLGHQGPAVYAVSGTPATVSASLRSFAFTLAAARLAPGASETVGFSLQVTDDAGGSDAATVSVIVTAPSNDVPVIAGVVSDLEMEPGDAINPFAEVTVTDPEDDAVTVTVALDNTDAGSFSSLGDFMSAGVGSWTLSASTSVATSSLQGLTFTPAADRLLPGESENVQFDIAAQDAFGFSATSTIYLTITAPPNDPPVVAGLPSSLTIDAGETVSPFALVTVSDAENDIVTLTLNMGDPAVGSFSSLGGFVDLGDGSYVLSAAPSVVTTDLQGLAFTPTEGRLAPGTSESVQFAITAEDAFGFSAAASVSLTISAPPNDPPVIAGAPSGLMGEPGQSLSPFASMSITDPDSVNVTLSLMIDDPAKGTLSSLGSFTDWGGGLYTLTARPSAATSSLQGVVFTPAEGRLGPEESETVAFELTAADDYESDTETVSVVVTAPTAPVEVCDAEPDIGTECDDGAIYAGELNGKKLFVHPSEVSRQFRYSNFVTHYTQDWNNGKQNTDGIANYGATYGQFPAAKYCRDLGPEWYLPSYHEMRAVIVTVLNPSSSRTYMSSTTENPPSMKVVHASFYGGSVSTFSRDPTAYAYVRCVRN